MTQAKRSEMTVPKWSFETIFYIVIFLILATATLVAIVSLLTRLQVIVPCIWLAIMVFGIWLSCKQDGGYRKVLMEYLELFSRRQFVESMPQDDGSVEIRFGFQLFGFRLFRFSVPLNKIDTVEWIPGQAPRFWIVALWFDHDDPDKSQQRQKWHRHPDQDVYIVGPERRKKKTEAFGLAFVDFLRRAGATLVQREDERTFVRATSATGQTTSGM